MKKVKSTMIILCMAITSLIAQNKQDAIIGIWETDTKDARSICGDILGFH
jgi:hypothetical protein